MNKYINAYNNFIMENNSALYSLNEKENKIMATLLKNGLIEYVITGNVFNTVVPLFFTLPSDVKGEIRNILKNEYDQIALKQYFIVNMHKYIIHGYNNEAKLMAKSLEDLGLVDKCSVTDSGSILVDTGSRHIKMDTIKSNILTTNIENNCYGNVEQHMINDERNIEVIGISQRHLTGIQLPHVSVVYDNFIEDYTQNSKMSISDYNHLYNYEIVFLEKRQTVINEIMGLNYTDKDFALSPNSNMCKYFYYKEFQKHEK